MTFCPLPKAFHVTFLLVRVDRTHPSLGPGHHWLQWSPPKYQPAPPRPREQRTLLLVAWTAGVDGDQESSGLCSLFNQIYSI